LSFAGVGVGSGVSWYDADGCPAREDGPLSNRQMTLDVAAVVAREVAVTLRSGLWPFARLRPLPRPDPRSERLPVVMVHGFMGHPEMFRPLARSLLAAGWGRIERVHYPSTQLNLEEIVDRIDQVVRPLVQDGGQIDLVGHSLGAVASRAYLKVFGGAQYVRRFVSLGGPHHGTAWHPLLPPPAPAGLRP
jgi:triacylglycerol esterase/lipase EstA (alpha/beta hydrolase family)